MASRLLDKDRFLFGTFASNCSGAMSVTTVPERWVSSWDNNLKLALLLDEAGFDFMLPIARWIGYGGKTDFQGSVLETITWATGLLAKTHDLTVFATVHTAANHPVVVAKQLATIDQISGGRIGLNIVAGWNKPEYEALGLDLPVEHTQRYGYAQEWFDVMKALWTRPGPFDWDGQHFHLKGTYGDPRPSGRIPILNAAGSGEGRAFATGNADFLFTPAIDMTRSAAEITELKAQGKAAGRDIDVLTFAHVICRPTEKEALDYRHHYAQDNVDTEALDTLMRLQFAHAQSFPHDLLAQIRDSMASGHGGFPLTGTPEQVVEGIATLKNTGFKGVALSFVDYVEEFPYFRDAVMPLLIERGLMQPKAAL